MHMLQLLKFLSKHKHQNQNIEYLKEDMIK